MSPISTRSDDVSRLKAARAVGQRQLQVAELNWNAGTEANIASTTDLEVEMWLGRVSGAAKATDDLPCPDHIALADIYAARFRWA